MTNSAAAPRSRDAYAKARFNMVESQIRPNRVTDERLLEALSEVPREMFVPPASAGIAYVDQALRVAPDRYLLEPLFLGRLLQEAVIQPRDNVLAVGSATGYSAAIVARLASSVVALDSDSALTAAAGANLARLGIANVTVVTGPLMQGVPAKAPYDVILIDGTIAALPDAIAGQLAENGRLVAILSQDGRHGAGMLYRKRGGSISGRVLFDAVGPFLPGFEPQPAFVF